MNVVYSGGYLVVLRIPKFGLSAVLAAPHPLISGPHGLVPLRRVGRWSFLSLVLPVVGPPDDTLKSRPALARPCGGDERCR